MRSTSAAAEIPSSCTTATKCRKVRISMRPTTQIYIESLHVIISNLYICNIYFQIPHTHHTLAHAAISVFAFAGTTPIFNGTDCPL